MKMQRFGTVGLASLACSVLMLMMDCGVASSSSVLSMGCIPDFFGDGDCDGVNNNEECGE